MQLTFRSAGLTDLGEVWDLVSRAIVHMTKQNILQWDELYPTKEDLQADIEMKQLYVGLNEGRLAVIYVLNQECEPEYAGGNWQYPELPFYIIHRLCVHPAYQHQGIAKQTLLHIEEELKDFHIHAIRLDVFSQNPFALKLYEGMGYTRTGHAQWRKGLFYLMEKYF